MRDRLVEDLLDALDGFWPYIEARKHVGNPVREAHPDYIRLGDAVEKARDALKADRCSQVRANARQGRESGDPAARLYSRLLDVHVDLQLEDDEAAADLLADEILDPFAMRRRG